MRRRDWAERLEVLVRERMNRPFEWGVSDCTLWAADVVEAVTGSDPAQAYRGRYDSALSAARILRDDGGLEHLCDQMLGVRIHPALARAGDVGLFVEGDNPALAAHLGYRWYAQGQNGIVLLPSAAIVTAWRCDQCPQP